MLVIKIVEARSDIEKNGVNHMRKKDEKLPIFSNSEIYASQYERKTHKENNEPLRNNQKDTIVCNDLGWRL